MSISASAVLVELNISVWTATKLDRSATEDVISSNLAQSDAAVVRKNLMSGTRILKDISDYASQCRLCHNTQTLPWADKGVRMLPSAIFLEYKSEMNNRKQQFDLLVDKFLFQYPTLAKLSAGNLGSLFDSDDYPHVDDVREKFGFHAVFSPVPESGDFRLDVPAQELVEIQGQYEQNFNKRLDEAMRAPWARLFKMLNGMSEKLVDADEGARKRFHDTFLSNAMELCDLLQALNVTKDPKLEDARRKLKVSLQGVTMDGVKEDPHVRRVLKKNVDAILKQFDW